MKRPLFWTVQGTDFGRSNKWAKQYVSPVQQAIRDKIKENDRSNNTCITSDSSVD